MLGAMLPSARPGCNLPVAKHRIALRGPHSRLQPRQTITRFREETPAVGGERGRQVTLHISTHFKAAFGEQLKLVGNTPELGQWNVPEAPGMQWTDDHYWVTDVDLPEGASVQFKIVHVGHNGIKWEPGYDKVMKAEAHPGASAIAVKVAWGEPDIQFAGPIKSAEVVAAAEERSLSDDFDDLWDPIKAGLPQDITEELATPITKASKENAINQKYDVTLEPEWAIFGPQKESSAAESSVELDAGNQQGLQETADTVLQDSAEEAAELETAKASGVIADSPKLLKKKRKPKEKINGLRAAGQAAGYAAAGVAAAVVMSALAVDITDAAIASAIVAAGATFLPSAVDSEGKKKAIEGKGAASPVLGAVELGLKARAIVQGLGTNPEKPAEEEGIPVDRTVEEYIAAKASEAEQFALNYHPTEEDLFESSPLNLMTKDANSVESVANNAVSTEGMSRGTPTSSKGNAGQLVKNQQ